MVKSRGEAIKMNDQNGVAAADLKEIKSWAVYNTTNGMPRFYALISKVLSIKFKLQIRGFESNLDYNDEGLFV
ncbi:hypothetical protein RJT34_15593 [Clitoria ternatea]|uniref:DUF3444 domain-containing protein n=1 Tax=Clitoria ternatea TaxID=43366 RepID=A0AAN9J737_CLITE